MRRVFCLPLAWIVLAATFASADAASPRTAAASSEPVTTVASTDWPWWRGPQRNGIASPDQTPPTSWSDTQNVVWKTSVPGRGHGSPIVAGDHVLLQTAEADSETQSVMCFDRGTGEVLWKTVIHTGGFPTKGNQKSSLASSSVACDDQRIYVNFLNAGAVHTTALSRDGKQLWQTKISDYVVHQGYGSSPALYEKLVIVSADNKGGGAIAGLDRKTGNIVWRNQRPATPNYPSPVVLHVAGRDQLLMTGCDVVAGFDPLTGKSLWQIDGSTTECVTSTVTDGELIITSGGYPKNHVAAVRADGSGEIVWENTLRVYVPSMLIRDGYLYAVADAGIAMCLRCSSGEEVWKARLQGAFTASPVLVGDLIYATNEDGETFIYKATASGYEAIGRNDLGDDVYATPTFCDSRMYARVGIGTGADRREMLYCIGNAP